MIHVKKGIQYEDTLLPVEEFPLQIKHGLKTVWALY